jgi:hypothetical protein
MSLDVIQKRFEAGQGALILALLGIQHGIYPFMDLMLCLRDGPARSLGACSTSSVVFAGFVAHGILVVGAGFLLIRGILALKGDEKPELAIA